MLWEIAYAELVFVESVADTAAALSGPRAYAGASAATG
jgi:hypothetical protein